jgi:cardiolipin synthase
MRSVTRAAAGRFSAIAWWWRAARQNRWFSNGTPVALAADALQWREHAAGSSLAPGNVVPQRIRHILSDHIFGRRSAAGIGRGVAAGVAAAMLPLPLVKVVLAIVPALLLRGSKRAAVLAAAVSLLVPPMFLADVQYDIGCRLWPGDAGEARPSAGALGNLSAAWSQREWGAWVAPDIAALAALDSNARDRLVLGAASMAAVLALLCWPTATVGVMTWRAWIARYRLRRRPRPPQPPLTLPAGGETFHCRDAVDRYVRKPDFCQPARAVEILVNGVQTYGRMLEAIASSRRTVDLESYILCDDATGRRFHGALCEAARRQVRVRVLYDYMGSLALPRVFIEQLAAAGASVGVYNPPALARASWRALNRRDHRKLLVVDEAVTFTGGLNIGDLYGSSPLKGSGGWRDTHVRIEGARPAGQASRLFAYAWRKAVPYHETTTRRHRLRAVLRRLALRRLRRRGALEGGDPDRPTCEAGIPVRMLGNREFGRRNRVYQAYLHAIRGAHRYILIENAYFLPNHAVRKALARAVRRGVQVVVVVSRETDVQIVASAARYLYSRLLSAGIRLFEWPEGMLHAKTAVIDDAWSIIGSYNFDYRSLFHQLECAAMVVDPAVAGALREQTLADLARCREVTLEEHESRPVARVLAESMAYLVRNLL